MSYIKTKEEIEIIKEGGRILGDVLESISDMVSPGISAWEIDREAERLIRKYGGAPSFKGYRRRPTGKAFPSTICACLNDELVHGIALKEKILNDGDILSIDIGMLWPYEGNGAAKTIKSEGLYTDTSLSVAVGNISPKAKHLLDITRKSLEIGINACKAGNTVADIGKAIQSYIEPLGYGIVRDLIGHGVGHSVHEEPGVPNYYDKESEAWELKPGVVLALEPMITLGGYNVVTNADGWTISTKDKSLCAHFEHTVVITESAPIVATRRPKELV